MSVTKDGVRNAGSLSRRNFGFASLAMLAAPPALARDLSGVTLRIGTFRGQDQTVLPGTGLNNFPYKVAYSEFAAGNLITQAINADALDIGSWSEIPLVFAAAAHANIRVIATMEGPAANQAVIVPKTSQAKSIADLRGKRVGYIRATTAHYFLIKMLAQHNMSFTDIQPVALSMSAGLTAMQSGALDAWATYGYAIPVLQSATGARVLQNAIGILSGNYLIGANPRGLTDPAFRAAAADYISRLGHAYRILYADRPRFAKLLAPAVQIPEAIALAYLQGQERGLSIRPSQPSDIKSAQDVAETFTRAGLLPGHVDVAPYFSDALKS
jgi:sulfonate transport system substrate-binding protein